MPMMNFADHKRKQHHVFSWISGAKIKAECPMSHMVACCIVWQIALQNLGVPSLANLEIQ